MIKKISALAIAAMIALPASVGAAPSSADLAAQIDALSKELDRLKQEMAQVKSTAEDVETLKENSEKWDLSSRIQFSGDFRSRIDFASADTTRHWTAMSVGSGVADWMTVGNVMNRYNSANGGAATIAQFAYAVNDNFDNPVNGTLGTWTDLNADGIIQPLAGEMGAANSGGNIPVTAAEWSAIRRVFGSATVGGLLGPMMGMVNATDANTATSAPIAGTSTTFTNLQNLTGFMKNLSAAQRQAVFTEMGYNMVETDKIDNDTMWTNRFRLNLRAKATEDVEFKGRLAMYKTWGMQANPVDYQANGGMGGGPYMLSSMFTGFDGGTTRQPSDNILRVDRAYVNWDNIGGLPVWFSIGRRPTSDGPPAQLRLGADQIMATPVAYMDWPFDGLTVGYAYDGFLGNEDLPGRIRFCYGRGFESGPTGEGGRDGINDVDFAGFNWDVFKNENRFLNIQSFGAYNVFNVPDGITFPNPVEYYLWQIDPTQFDPTVPSKNLILDRANLGNIFHTDAVYMSKVNNLNYFLSLGWSRTEAEGMDEMGTSLLGSFYDVPSNKNGYSLYTGIRYDMPDHPFRLGLEWNMGSRNWIGLTPGHDDLYASKLAARGQVVEAYTIWNIPAGEAISKYGKAFVRLGYQHYNYEYTGSGFWLGEPQEISEIQNDPLKAQFYTPVDNMDQIYLTFEAWF